ncbi:MAG TPA: SUF system Fe-S cluster assembly protein [Planctomycetota bacterium]|nr:SUF system Fe-S cluster assembly protein [Planctomycetota bacterium]
MTLVEARNLKERVIAVMKTIFDPEIPVNIYELGMVYNISVDLQANVEVIMTLTSPACPVAGSLPGEVQNKIKATPGVNNAKVNLVWQPPWNKDMMSEAAKLQLNIA